MADNSLGTLGVNIAAYAGQFMAELTRAEDTMNKFQRSLSRTFTKAGLDAIGLGNAARAMSNELQFVWANFEKIKGINPATIASIQEMKTSVEEFQQTIHRLVAGGMGLFSDFGKSIGLVAGAIAQSFSRTKFTDLFTNPTAIAKNFAAALAEVDVALKEEFDSASKAAHAENALSLAKAKTTNAIKDANTLLKSMIKSGDEFARAEAANAARMKSDGEAIRREMLTPLEEWAEQLVRLNELLGASAISQETFNRAMRASDIKLKTDEASASAAAMDKLRDRVFDPMEGADFDRIRTASEEFRDGMNDMWREVSDGGAAAFVDLINTGENAFGNLINMATRAAEQMVAKLLVINPILNAVSGIFGVKSALPAAWSFGGARAEGGPVRAGTSYLVGERGPERFVPQSSGTIVPNLAVKSQGGNGDTYYIDARGADRTGLNELAATIKALNGSIEQRAISAVYDYRRRGGHV